MPHKTDMPITPTMQFFIFYFATLHVTWLLPTKSEYFC